MAQNRPTVLQNLNRMFLGNSVPVEYQKTTASNFVTPNPVLYTANNKGDYDTKLQQMKQQKLLSYQWVKAGADIATENLSGYNNVRLMYRDADLMETMPEIGTALNIYSEEACAINSKGKMLNIYSKSPRIKAVLEDLFINRLQINVTLPRICRGMCKYGNNYELLNINVNEGIMGWKELNTYEIDRIENGYSSSSAVVNMPNLTDTLNPDEVYFSWIGHNESQPYYNWQVAHFRMLNDSFFLPYGTSVLHKARRAWRMLSMMEDSLLIYRLDKSIERRVFKVYVGAIDDADVPAFVQEVANNFKRTPIIDPATGQVDLRKNFMDVSTDYFIPVRREDAPNPIETLQSAHNDTAIEDIKHMESKILSALRVPKTFLNFQSTEGGGKGQNLSLLDIRFCRMINQIQQYLLLELNKVAMIHLYILGFKDDLGNFTLSLNNPSAQIEALELEDITKRVQTAQAALADPGTGIPLMSMHRVCKEILKMTDNEIKDMLNEIRLEKAMSAELAATPTVIKKTGVFDTVDRIYGDIGSLYAKTPQQPQQDPNAPGGPGGAPPGGDMGGALHMDSLGGGGDMGGDIGGETEEGPMSEAPEMDSGEPLQEIHKSFTERYFELLTESQKKSEDEMEDVVDYIGKNMNLSEEIERNIDILENVADSLEKNQEIIEESLEEIKTNPEVKSILEE